MFKDLLVSHTEAEHLNTLSFQGARMIANINVEEEQKNITLGLSRAKSKYQRAERQQRMSSSKRRSVYRKAYI